MIEPFKPITREEAAGILSVSLTTLDELVKAGALPAPRALGGQRRLYWHPAVFYSHLDRALTTESPDTLPMKQGEAMPMTHAASGQAAPIPPRVEKTPSARPSPTRTLGYSSARARQAARMKKLNE